MQYLAAVDLLTLCTKVTDITFFLCKHQNHSFQYSIIDPTIGNGWASCIKGALLLGKTDSLSLRLMLLNEMK